MNPDTENIPTAEPNTPSANNNCKDSGYRRHTFTKSGKCIRCSAVRKQKKAFVLCQNGACPFEHCACDEGRGVEDFPGEGFEWDADEPLQSVEFL